MRTIASIIAEAEKETTDKAQAKVLKDNSSAALKMVVGCAMDPIVKFLLPPGEPPYRALPNGSDAEGRLYQDARMLEYLTTSEVGKQITQLKREQMFTNLLESIDPDDAKLLCRVKDKQLKLSMKAVKMAFPSMTAQWP